MTNQANNDCIFCQIINGKAEPGKGKVYEDDKFMAILDLYPKAKNHTLIISKKHYKTLLDLPTSQGNELQEAIKNVSLDLINTKKAEAINVLSNVGEIAGQIVSHLHVHIIPRKKDDNLKIIS
jgi:histidine triad (HIT) family protein